MSRRQTLRWFRRKRRFSKLFVLKEETLSKLVGPLAWAYWRDWYGENACVSVPVSYTLSVSVNFLMFASLGTQWMQQLSGINVTSY